MSKFSYLKAGDIVAVNSTSKKSPYLLKKVDSVSERIIRIYDYTFDVQVWLQKYYDRDYKGNPKQCFIAMLPSEY